MPLIHPNARHGTVSGYVNWGCRCDECTEANRKAKASRRALRMAERIEEESTKQIKGKT